MQRIAVGEQTHGSSLHQFHDSALQIFTGKTAGIDGGEWMALHSNHAEGRLGIGQPGDFTSRLVITRRVNLGSYHGAQAGDIFGGIVCRTRIRITQAHSHNQNRDRLIHQSNRAFDLFQTSQADKRCHRIDVHLLALQGDSRRHVDHVLLGDTGMNELVGQFIAKPIKGRRPKVCADKIDVGIFFSGCPDFFNKSVSLETFTHICL